MTQQRSRFQALGLRWCSAAVVLFLTHAISPAIAQSPREEGFTANGLQVDISWNTEEPPAAVRELLEEAKGHRVIEVRAPEDSGLDEAQLLARQRVILALARHSGVRGVVLPVGIFEGVSTDRALDAGSSAEEAAATLYRVWREDPAFLELLQALGNESGLELIGGLCRFHAVGKSLYPSHLRDFVGDSFEDSLLDRFDSSFGGTDRLSKATPEAREVALEVAEELRRHFEAVRSVLEARHGRRLVALEGQILRNLRTFVELEQLRAGDLPGDPGFEEHELGDNLNWFLEDYFAGETVVFWRGRGQGEIPVAEADLFTIDLRPSSSDKP